MNMLLPTIILVVLGCLYAGSLKTPKDRLCAVVCILVVILFLCYFQMKGCSYEHFNGYAPLGYTMQNGGSDGNTGCGGYNYGDINSQIGIGSTYDGIRLKSNLVSKPIINDVTIFTPTGDGVKLTEPLGNKDYISIDGNPNSPKFLFSYAKNKVSWDCEGSTNLHSDMGPVCYTPEQLKMFGHRGGNASPRDKEYPGI